MIDIKEKFKKEAIPAMKEKFGYKNIMAIPKIEKVVINSGFGKLITASKSTDETKKITKAISDGITEICGQRPALTKAKNSIAGFKLREGMVVGARVTLRGQKMYDFLEKVINVALPRSRDFQGLNPKSVDGGGNFTFAVKEHIIFPEIAPEDAKIIFGFEVTVVTTAKNKEEGLELLKLVGFPFKK